MWLGDAAIQLPSGDRTSASHHAMQTKTAELFPTPLSHFVSIARLMTRPSATASGDFMPSSEALEVIRSWIAVGQATAPVLGDDLTAAIPEDFVRQRQADSKVSVAETFVFAHLKFMSGQRTGFGPLAYHGKTTGES
jgi:hypothetical protein